MRSVLVETNWVVDWAAPVHHRKSGAERLLERARAGEFRLHVPSVSLVEARKVITTRFVPRREAHALRTFAHQLAAEGRLSEVEQQVVARVCASFEDRFSNELQGLDGRIGALAALPYVEVYALDDEMLAESVRLASEPGLDLAPFDAAIFSSVLVLGRRLRQAGVEVCFAELDADLQPWRRDKSTGQWGRKQPLSRLYDEAQIWVYGDFDLGHPDPGAGWVGWSLRGEPA
jgi:predicted nucleic acid-binding protein